MYRKNTGRKTAILLLLIIVALHSGEVVSARDEQKAESSFSNNESHTAGSVSKSENLFRFQTVDAAEALIKQDDVYIYEENDEKARIVGEIKKYGLCYVLKQEKDWSYIESGAVRGFVKNDHLITGTDAQRKIAEWSQKPSETGEESDPVYKVAGGKVSYSVRVQESGNVSYRIPVDELNWKQKEVNETPTPEQITEPVLTLANPLVEPVENQAVSYIKITTMETAAEKIYALANKKEVFIREGKGETNRITGVLYKGGLCYVLADNWEQWVFVESGDVRGFVNAEDLLRGETIIEEIEENGEESFELAEERIPPDENKVRCYTLTSVKQTESVSDIRNSILDAAMQLVGNPYSWGGTSLENGADCSGFVQSIFAQYGYSLPRSAAEQAEAGTSIPVKDALPGDLIFYEKKGIIYHVLIYIGEGKGVSASNEATGIKISEIHYELAVRASRIITDNEQYPADMQ